MAKLNSSLKRDITHISYPSNRKRNDHWAGYMPFKIVEKPNDKKNEYVGEKKDMIYLSNAYIVCKDSQYIFPFIFGGIGLLFFVFELFDWLYKENWDSSDTILLLLSISLVIFFVVYYFTIPLKQVIYNRYDGLITFPGFL